MQCFSYALFCYSCCASRYLNVCLVVLHCTLYKTIVSGDPKVSTGFKILHKCVWLTRSPLRACDSEVIYIYIHILYYICIYYQSIPLANIIFPIHVPVFRPSARRPAGRQLEPDDRHGPQPHRTNGSHGPRTPPWGPMEQVIRPLGPTGPIEQQQRP